MIILKEVFSAYRNLMEVRFTQRAYVSAIVTRNSTLNIVDNILTCSDIMQ